MDFWAHFLEACAKCGLLIHLLSNCYNKLIAVDIHAIVLMTCAINCSLVLQILELVPLLYLAYRNVIRRLGQSLITAIIITLVTLLGTSSLIVAASLAQGIALSQNRLGADIMVLPAGASARASEVLFSAQPVNVYLSVSLYEDIASTTGVEMATPQFFTQTVDESCCSVVGISRIVGIDLQSDFVISPWITGPSVNQLGPDEILVGSAAPEIEGNQASILGKTFRVVGVLEETGTSVDETIFMDIASAQSIAANSPYLTGIWGDENDTSNLVSCIMIRMTPEAIAEDVISDIVNSNSGVIAVTSSELILGISSTLSAVGLAYICVFAILIVIAALALAGRYSALAMSRIKELGLMRTMGVGKVGIFGSLLLETGLITLASALVGALIACGVSSLVLDFLYAHFSIPGISPAVGMYIAALVLGVGFSLILNIITVLLVSLKVLHVDPQISLARGDL